jgi:hypothetical protein
MLAIISSECKHILYSSELSFCISLDHELSLLLLEEIPLCNSSGLDDDDNLENKFEYIGIDNRDLSLL